MAILHLEVKFFKRQKRYYPEDYYSRCPCPQYNNECQGLFIKTRRWQVECVSCMILHNTIEKHPLLVKINHPIEYKDYDLDEYITRVRTIHL